MCYVLKVMTQKKTHLQGFTDLDTLVFKVMSAYNKCTATGSYYLRFCVNSDYKPMPKEFAIVVFEDDKIIFPANCSELRELLEKHKNAGKLCSNPKNT